MKVSPNVVSPLAAIFALFGIDLDEVRPAMRRFRVRRKRDPLRYQRHTARRDDRRPMTPGLVKRWRLAMLAVAKDLKRRAASARAGRHLTRARLKKLWASYPRLAAMGR